MSAKKKAAIVHASDSYTDEQLIDAFWNARKPLNAIQEEALIKRKFAFVQHAAKPEDERLKLTARGNALSEKLGIQLISE